MARVKKKKITGAPTIPTQVAKPSNLLKGLFSKADLDLAPELENKLNGEQETQLSELVTSLTQSIDANEKSQTELTTKQQGH